MTEGHTHKNILSRVYSREDILFQQKMNCTSKYKRCECKLCKKKTRLRAKQDSCKNVLDKINNGMKRLFHEPPTQKPPLLPVVKVCENCGSENILEEDNYFVCIDCGVEKDKCPYEERRSICYEDIQESIRYLTTKTLQFKEYIHAYQGNNLARITPDLIAKVKQNLPELPSKKDVLKVMKSDPELKDFSTAVHAIYYRITGNSPVDFRRDECYFLCDLKDLLKFYSENPPKRNKFEHHYVLYYLLKRRDYPVTLEDFPEIRGSRATEKLCNNFFTRNCT